MAKYLAQMVMLGAQVVGRAFSRALKQEFAASQSAANQRRTNNATNESATSARLGMSVQEAMQILNVDTSKMDELNREIVEKNFSHLFEVNDKAKGGSFYLQSKVVRAKERIDEELRRVNPKEFAENIKSERKESQNQ